MTEQQCLAHALLSQHASPRAASTFFHPLTKDTPEREFNLQMSAKLGEILVRENLISPQHLREALDYQREHGGRLGFNLVKLGLVSDDMITAVLSRQYGIPSVNLDLFQIDDSVLRLIPQEVAQKHSVLPLSRVGATLTLAMQTFNQALATLYHTRKISLDIALQRSSNVDELRELIDRGAGLNTGGGQGNKQHPSPYAQPRPIGSRPSVPR